MSAIAANNAAASAFLKSGSAASTEANAAPNKPPAVDIEA